MTTASDIDNQDRLFNAIFRLEKKLDRTEERIDRRLDQIERRVVRIEDAIYDIRDYLRRNSSRDIGFGPSKQTSTTDREDLEDLNW